VGYSLLPELYRVAVERRPTATASANERLSTLIVLLSDLVEAAEQCALKTGTQYRQRRVGIGERDKSPPRLSWCKAS